MPLTQRALLSLSSLALAFLALFHRLVMSDVHPAFFGFTRAWGPALAGLWGLAAVEGWWRRHSLAPAFALGLFGALAYGFLLRAEGARLLGWVFVAIALAGLVSLGRLYFRYLERPPLDSRGEAGRHLLNQGRGFKALKLRKTR
jgi:hypothetical protein